MMSIIWEIKESSNEFYNHKLSRVGLEIAPRPNKYPEYDTKPSDIQASVLVLWKKGG